MKKQAVTEVEGLRYVLMQVECHLGMARPKALHAAMLQLVRHTLGEWKPK